LKEEKGQLLALIEKHQEELKVLSFTIKEHIPIFQ